MSDLKRYEMSMLLEMNEDEIFNVDEILDIYYNMVELENIIRNKVVDNEAVKMTLSGLEDDLIDTECKFWNELVDLWKDIIPYDYKAEEMVMVDVDYIGAFIHEEIPREFVEAFAEYTKREFGIRNGKAFLIY